jgi:glycosyltransferase involved in cell wall biosynthesis
MPGKIGVLYLRQAAGGGGGADTVILNTVSHMDTDRFCVILAYMKKREENIGPVLEKLRGKGIPYFELPGKSIIDLAQLRNICRLIREHNIKILHSHDPKTDLYGYLLGFIFPRLKLVSTIHGWIERRIRSRYYVKIDRFVLKRFDAVIAVSGAIMQIAQTHGISRLHLIRNSINVNKWQPVKRGVSSERQGRFMIGFVGRISREKGPFDYVHIAVNILKKYPDTEFLVAGKGPEEESMKKLLQQTGIASSFYFQGQLDEQQLRELYSKLDLLLLTSYTEGLPITVLEASAMGVPLVATRVGGVCEIIQDGYNGLLADAGDIETLSVLALKVLEDKALADKFKRNGRKKVEEEFSLAASVKEIEGVYERVLSATT